MNDKIEGADVATRKKPGPKPGFKKADVEQVPRETKVDPDLVAKEKAAELHARIEKMSLMCQRQWDGQSPQLSIGERVSRMRIAMKLHGFIDIFEHLILNESTNPTANNPSKATYDKHL